MADLDSMLSADQLSVSVSVTRIIGNERVLVLSCHHNGSLIAQEGNLLRMQIYHQ